MPTVTEGLNGLTADAMVMYQKLHHYHWNITGEEFFSLHAKFQELYEYFALVLDDLAERVLTIGGEPPRTLAEVLKLASLKEDPGLPKSDKEFLQNTIDDLNAFRDTALKLTEMAEKAEDRGTVVLLDDLTGQIEKHVWMLKANLKKK